ncbi:hypothetical protein BDQ12DRAFT_685855 [Crucibulum laeve]|uniref:Uncharacterized protein n=1 Tax=Crucibulum laeve TaxID=68775 RepID=A0A5C3LZ23_9AGAR|nr:hypothetical protein BDQ12DRAFT_685855 [Crucibulum laeve]
MGIPTWSSRRGLGPQEAVAFELRIIVTAILIETLLYGIHVILFLICTYILFKNQKPAQLLIFISVAAMFALSTADIVLSFRAMIIDMPNLLYSGSLPLMNALFPKLLVFVVNNLVADIVLV